MPFSFKNTFCEWDQIKPECSHQSPRASAAHSNRITSDTRFMFVCTCRRNSRSYITAGWVGTLETDFLTVYWEKRGQLKKPSAVQKPHGLMPRGQFKPQCSSSFNWSNCYIGLSHSLTQAMKSSYTSFCFKQDTN